MALFGKTSERLKYMGRRSSGFTAMAPDGGSGLQRGAREIRAHAVHRLQVGIFGLAAMLLLVSLASVIMQRVQTADRSVIAAAPSGDASTASANDPLADLGVAPEVPVAGTPAAHARQARPSSAH